MNTPSPKDIAHLWAAAYNQHNPESAIALYHDDVTNEQLPWGKSIQGKEAMLATYRKIFQAFPDLNVELLNVLEDQSWAFVEWRFQGTMRGEFAGHQPNQSRFDLRGCELFQILDGKIFIQRGYWDKATMFAQLGLS